MKQSYPLPGLLALLLLLCSLQPLRAQAPANDDPCGAVVLTPSGQFCATPTVGNTQGATITVPNGYTNTGTCGGVATGSFRDVWYQFTTTASGLGSTGATITVAGNAAGQVRLFSAPSCSGPFTDVACQAATQANTSAPALTTTALAASTTYYVRVAGNNSATSLGPFSICLTDGPGTPPLCQSAQLGAPVFTNASNTAASFTFTPLATNVGPYTFTLLSGPTGSTVVQSFSINAPGFTVSGLVPGTNYSIRVTGYCTAGGQFQIARQLSVLPPNDDPCGAQALVLNTGAVCTPVTGSTRATTTTPNGYTNPGCGGAALPGDVWYTFATTASGAGSTGATLTVSDVEGASQLRLFAAASCAGPFTELACTTGTVGAAPLVATGLVPNTTYYVSVAPAQFRVGTFFTICASAAAPVFPCLTPTIIIPSTTVTGTSAQVVFTVPAGGSPAPPSYTLTYTPQGGGATVTVTPPYGPVLSPNQPVYQAGTPLTGLTPGTTYVVTVQTTCVGGAQSSVATATFTTLATTAPQPPANDECSGATVLPVTTSCIPLATTNLNALAVGLSGSATTCGYYLGADVWYQLVVPPNGIVQVTTGPVAGSVVDDTGLALLTGSCGNLTEVDCNDDISATNLFSQARATGLVPGSIVYAQVWRTGSLVGGPFTICATTDVTCPVVSNLAATAVTQTGATLTFALPTGSGGYVLSYTAAGGTVQTQPVTTSPVVLTGLTPGTVYTVSITNNCSGSLPSTAILSFTTLAVPTCAAPAAVYASNVGNTSAGIGFVLNAAATSYAVTYQAAGGPVQTVSPAPTASPVTLTGLVPGTSYTVCVASTCANGLASVPRCAPVFTTTGTAPTCAAPTGATASSTGPTTAQVSFAPAAGVASYTVTYTAAGGTAQTLTPNPTASPVALAGLTPGVAYTVTVASNCAGGTVSVPTLATFATPLASRSGALAEQLTLYPNPAHHSASLTVPAALLRQASLLTLSDALGRTVRQRFVTPTAGTTTETRAELNLTGLPAGVYLIRLLSSEGPLTKRLVIE
jgi:hypothetical protein